jgi:hypothetical protein
MFYSNTGQLLARLLAITAIMLSPAAANAATSGDISAAQVINTSPVLADSASYHACNVANVSTATISVAVELISNGGAVLRTATVTLPAGDAIEIANNGQSPTYVGLARCRFTTNYAPTTIRANIVSVFQTASGATQTFALSEAR